MAVVEIACKISATHSARSEPIPPPMAASINSAKTISVRCSFLPASRDQICSCMTGWSRYSSAHIWSSKLTFRSIPVMEINDLIISATCLVDSSASSREGEAKRSRFDIHGPTYCRQAVFCATSALPNPMVHSLRNSRVRYGAFLASVSLRLWTKAREFAGKVMPAIYQYTSRSRCVPVTLRTP